MKRGVDEHRRVGRGVGGSWSDAENNTAAIVPVLLFRLASFTPLLPPLTSGVCSRNPSPLSEFR